MNKFKEALEISWICLSITAFLMFIEHLCLNIYQGIGLEVLDNVFTFIIIIEMLIHLAIGAVYKYCKLKEERRKNQIKR